jgi:excisionase family DNA binding protein
VDAKPKYVQAQRIAELLQMPEESIRRLARTHKIPAIKLGNLWRFDEAKVLKYLEKKCSNDYSD